MRRADSAERDGPRVPGGHGLARIRDSLARLGRWLEARLPGRLVGAGLGGGPEAPRRFPLLGRRRAKRLRILTYRWHCGHQYELHKLPHEFTLVSGLTETTRRWEYGIRPLRPNARIVDLEAVDLDGFDLAILHFDQHSLFPWDSRGVLPADWGELFKHLHGRLRIPKIAICHGTPPLSREFFSPEDEPPEWPAPPPEVNEAERGRLVDFLGDTLVVCNSHQARREWGFRSSTVVWHGFDPAEYPKGSRTEGVLTVVAGLRRRPHYRGYALYREVTRGLPCRILSDDMPGSLRVPEPPFEEARPNDYARLKFRNYVRLVGRHSVFFNPTLRSCMPRSRAEAMLCGLAVVTARNHDVELFLENGVSGFHSEDPAELRGYLEHLLANPRAARKMGDKGREVAVRAFHSRRFLTEWEDLLRASAG